MNRRDFLKSVGALGIVTALPRSQRKSGPIRIAAANASPRAKAQADYLCTGHNDAEVFHRAIREAADRHPVLLTEGDFYLDWPVNWGSRGVTFNGQNRTTYHGTSPTGWLG